jgi:MerR family transcriptional regulator, redox-sensitive transcriptional activator SoxR
LPIAEVAARSGVAPSALRFYEARGLIAAERTAGGQRRYRREVLRRIAFIKAAQRVGLSLDEISEALAGLPSARTPTPSDWARLSRHWHARLEDRIRLLRELQHDLSSCIGCGCLSLRTCALSNPDDRAGDLGPGPRYHLGPGGPQYHLGPG